MGFRCLVRDQEVDGSNPFAPTTSLESATYKMRKSIERIVQCLFFQFNALHSVLDYEFYFILRTTRTTSVFLYRFGKLLFC